nr:response regulator [Micromonospora sp. DSM 115978]
MLVEDDLDYATYLAHVLRTSGGHAVTHVGDAEAALTLLHPAAWDILITDVDLPTLSGLEIQRRVRQTAPDLPVVIVTAHASLDNAVAALRSDANEFLPKPIRPEQLLEVVAELVQIAAEKAERSRRRVLAIGAHPDDVEIGVGGVLLSHRARGDHVAVLTLSHGARGGEADAR